jgi:hypothetical protein
MFTEFMLNTTLWVAVLAWAVAQLIKVVIDLCRFKKFNPSLMISSGGMPSSHSAFVMSLTASIGITEGLDSALFAVSAVVSLVVMYDAAGVRRAAGVQAQILNQLIASIENSGVKLDKKLKELLGHTPVQVFAGALLGLLVSAVFYNLGFL